MIGTPTDYELESDYTLGIMLSAPGRTAIQKDFIDLNLLKFNARIVLQGKMEISLRARCPRPFAG